jgi:large subunit ribosomal protein L10
MLVFQHNNLKADEWTGIRRELVQAFQKVDADLAASGVPAPDLSHTIKLQIIQTGIFAAALKIVEFYDPATAPKTEDGMTHILSKAAHEAVAKKRASSSLDPLLSGPLVLLTFPTVSPQHLKAALQILHPSKPDFPAPTRRANPGYYEIPVQSGLQKLLLMGARVEGKVFDTEGTKWVGGIQGGLDGLRAQVVYLLQSLGGSVASTLESASKSLYYTVEGRRAMLEEEEKGTVEAEGEAKKAE